MRIRAMVVGLALGAVGVAWLAAPASAQDPVYPPSNECGIRLSASAVRADQTFTINGAQGEADIPVTLTFESDPVVIATATTDAQGAFQVDASVPAGAEPGVHTIRVQGHTSCAAQVRVVGAETPVQPLGGGSRGSGLAYTGANLLVLVLIALVVLTVGFVLVAGERRHRTRRSTIRRERRARREQRDSHHPVERDEQGEPREPTLVG